MKRIATNLQSVEICSSMPAKIDPGERARPDRFHHLQILEPEVASNDVIVLDGVDVVNVATTEESFWQHLKVLRVALFCRLLLLLLLLLL